MKKILSVFLVVTMLLSMASVNIYAKENVFSDVKASDYYAEAATALAEEGILAGYPDGTFGPEKTIRRSEMATLICKMIGKADEAVDAIGDTKFEDVPATHWASGYVNIVSEEGIINGDGNGKFRPEDEVKYEEAIKMIVCALGLGDDVEIDKNDWSKGYLEVAEDEGITDSVKGKKGKAATRGDVAVMVYNGIGSSEAEVPEMPTVSLNPGEYTGTQKIKLATETKGADIYYTIDGTEPTEQSFKYTKEVSISKTRVLKAIAVKDGVSSEVLSANYKIVEKANTGGGGGSSTTKYKVIFDLNYEYDEDEVEAPETQSIKKGKKATEPTEPERDGYTFLGWSTDADEEEFFDFDTAIKKKTTLYAIWEEDDAGDDDDEEKFTVSFDLNYEGATGAPEKQKVAAGEKAYMPDAPDRAGYVFVEWCKDKECKEKFDFNNTAISEDTIIYGRWLNISDTTDTDKDGLTDPFEEFYGTDKTKADTDGDELSDYVEITVLGYDPLKEDSDNDGTKDGAEDADGDGLTNIEEVKNGTDPAAADTDNDGLSDKEEKTYNTDSNKADTDGDGVSDGKEVELGTDPIKAEDEFEVELTAADEGDSVSASVEIELSGEQVETLSIDSVDNETFFPEEMPGYMGKAYDFNVEGKFSSATISFEFDPSELPAGAVPTIYYFNEKDQSLEALDTTINGNVASAKVTHFSKYILINRTVYEESFCWVDDFDEGYKDIEIVFVVDDSGSMTSNDRNNERLVVAKDLIDKLPKGSKIGVVEFEKYTTKWTPTLVSDKEVAKGYLTKSYFQSNGSSTYMYDGILQSFGLFESQETKTMKMMVVLTDGIAHDASKYEDVKAFAIAEDVKIYAVGLGSYDKSLEKLGPATQGAFYLAENADELAGRYEEIREAIDLQTDSDGDGLCNYYEENLPAFNGVRMKLDKENEDTDGDGLLDGKEVTIVKGTPGEDGKVKVYGKINSDPTNPDSDYDGIEDADDKTPLDYTITDRTLAVVESLSYKNLSKYQGKTVGEAIADGVKFSGMTDENKNLLKNAVIIYSNHSGIGFRGEFEDRGLGSLAIKFNRATKPDAVVYALRGTEPKNDLVNDALTDLVLGLGWDSAQSKLAFAEYSVIAADRSDEYYITGHSLGGRLAQDVIYKIYKANSSDSERDIEAPVHSATFNALGYNKIVYMTLKNKILDMYKNKLTNFYYGLDLVGEGLGNAAIYTRAGIQVKLWPKDIKGKELREEPDSWISFRDSDYHGISYFVNDYQLLPTSKHNFKYWNDDIR